MFTSKRFLNAVSPFLLAFALPALPASDKIDLGRDTPVPANETIPVQDFFRAPILQQPVLNPSGTHIAAVVTSGIDHSALMVYNLTSKKIESAGSKGDTDIDQVWWLGEDRLAYRISVMKLGGFIICGAEVGALQSSYPILQNVSGALIAVPPKDRMHPLFQFNPHGVVTGQYSQVVTLSASKGTGKLLDLSGGGALLDGKVLDDAAEDNVRHIKERHPVLETPDGYHRNSLADKDGQLEFGITSTRGVYSLHYLYGDHWQLCPEDLDEINVRECGDNPGEIVVLGPRKDNQPRPLEVMKGTTGEVTEILVQDKAYDGNAWLYRDPVSHNIVGAVYDRAGPTVKWFSEAYRNLQKAVDALFPGLVVRIIGNDEAGKMVLISTYSDRQPAVYRWVDLANHTVGDIRQSKPWIDPKRMQPMSAIKYKTRDGRQLDAYVTMPAGASPKNPPPLVVLPPWWAGARHTWGYNDEVQFLASRGYAVLQPNHRGSAGTTWMFPTADEWAYRKMHEDVTEATKAMIASGLIDPTRVAIMGTDFGGFLALSGAAYEPGLYRCAIAISATADWGRAIAEAKYNKYNGDYYDWMVRRVGDPSQDPAKWDAIAPLRHANEIRAAVFIANGEFDSSFNIGTSKDVASAVERNHLPAETVTFTNESGGVRHIGNKVELYSRIEAFLAKNLAAR
jgi:pimeloyl-ACP methyl ester carboxylesterase